MLLLSLVVSSQNPFFVVVVAWAVCFCFAFCLFVCVLAVEMPLCPLLCLVVFLFFLCQCVLLCCSSVFPLCLLLPVSLDCWGLILCFCCVAHATAAAWCWAGVFPFLSFFFSSFFPFLLPCFLFLFLCHPSIQASITSRCCCIFSATRRHDKNAKCHGRKKPRMCKLVLPRFLEFGTLKNKNRLAMVQSPFSLPNTIRRLHLEIFI